MNKQIKANFSRTGVPWAVLGRRNTGQREANKNAVHSSASSRDGCELASGARAITAHSSPSASPPIVGSDGGRLEPVAASDGGAP